MKKEVTKTQNYRLLEHLSTGESITPVSALVNFGIARLASRVNELRNTLGYRCIDATMKNVNGKRYASYKINSNCCLNAAKTSVALRKLMSYRETKQS